MSFVYFKRWMILAQDHLLAIIRSFDLEKMWHRTNHAISFLITELAKLMWFCSDRPRSLLPVH